MHLIIRFLSLEGVRLVEIHRCITPIHGNIWWSSGVLLESGLLSFLMVERVSLMRRGEKLPHLMTMIFWRKSMKQFLKTANWQSVMLLFWSPIENWISMFYLFCVYLPSLTWNRMISNFFFTLSNIFGKTLTVQMTLR